MIGCLRLSNVSVICRVVNPPRTLQKIWEGLLYGVYRPQNDFQLIPSENFIQNRFTFGGVIAERVDTVFAP